MELGSYIPILRSNNCRSYFNRILNRRSASHDVTPRDVPEDKRRRNALSERVLPTATGLGATGMA